MKYFQKLSLIAFATLASLPTNNPLYAGPIGRLCKLATLTTTTLLSPHGITRSKEEGENSVAAQQMLKIVFAPHEYSDAQCLVSQAEKLLAEAQEILKQENFIEAMRLFTRAQNLLKQASSQLKETKKTYLTCQSIYDEAIVHNINNDLLAINKNIIHINPQRRQLLLQWLQKLESLGCPELSYSCIQANSQLSYMFIPPESLSNQPSKLAQYFIAIARTARTTGFANIAQESLSIAVEIYSQIKKLHELSGGFQSIATEAREQQLLGLAKTTLHCALETEKEILFYINKDRFAKYRLADIKYEAKSLGLTEMATECERLIAQWKAQQ